MKSGARTWNVRGITRPYLYLRDFLNSLINLGNHVNSSSIRRYLATARLRTCARQRDDVSGWREPWEQRNLIFALLCLSGVARTRDTFVREGPRGKHTEISATFVR